MTFSQFLSQFPVGSRNDFDGQFGYQCVDLANFYAQKVLGFYPGMAGINYAKHIWYSDQAFVRGAKSYQKIANSPENFPSPGDLVIWDGGPMGIEGHVAIVLEADQWEMKVLEQNGYTQRGVESKTYDYRNVLGWLHFPHIHNSQPFKETQTQNQPQENMQDSIIAQYGWGISHLAQAANLPDWKEESGWQKVANWNGYNRWEDLHAQFTRGTAIGKSYRIKPKPVVQEVKRESEKPTVIEIDPDQKNPTRGEINKILAEKDQKIQQVLEQNQAIREESRIFQEQFATEIAKIRADKLMKDVGITEEKIQNFQNERTQKEIQKIAEEIHPKSSKLGTKSDVWAKAIQQFIKHNLATGGVLATILTSLNQFDGLGGQIADFILGSQGFWFLTILFVIANIFLEYRAEKKKQNQNS